MEKLDFSTLFTDMTKYEIKQEIIDDQNNEKCQDEANKRIKEIHYKQFISAQKSKNYIHNYDDLPRAKE